ncbi:hypothetical protein HCH_05186 [Hahella chejuensis KCTC 2396]|uniref:Uncharacterized protein n=1 Tax=Hahella chejuensis (strain KCTC 2396) TaxID=349521 RepID=Q2SBW0_HAHCH|nr:hypothetical protein HCH_05186 [Hahella chejuensis KCTC 2396]
MNNCLLFNKAPADFGRLKRTFRHLCAYRVLL